MTNDDKVKLIANVLNGGYDDNTVPGGDSIYGSIAAPTDLLQTARHFAGPVLGNFMGYENIQRTVSVNPGQSVGEGWYSSHINNHNWAMMQNAMIKDMSRGTSNTFQQIAHTVGLPTNIEAYAGQAGAFLGAAMLQSSTVTDLMGGNPAVMYQRMFANRTGFSGFQGEFIDPLDLERQDHATAITRDLTSGLNRGIRGNPDGSIGLLPDLGFTRGFRDEQLANMAVTLQQSGRYTGLAQNMTDDRLGGDMKGYGDKITGFKNDIGKYAALMEAMGETLGTTDERGIMASLDKLTQGNWSTAMADPQAITQSIREIQGLADVLGRSKGEMINAVSSIQNAMTGGIGISPGMMSAGITGGGYTSMEAATDMTSSIYGIATAQGDMSAANISRITQQQVALQSINRTSGAGRANAALTYLYEQGLVSADRYESLSTGITMGDSGVRNDSYREIGRVLGGSEQRGINMMNDDRMMAIIRNSTSSLGAIGSDTSARAGAISQYADRFDDSAESRYRGSLDSMIGASGRTYGVNPVDAVNTKRISTLQYMRDNGAEVGAQVAEDVYNSAIADGQDPEMAYSRMQSQIRNMRDVLPKGMSGKLEKMNKRSQNDMDYNMLTSDAGKASYRANAIVKAAMSMDLTDEQMAEVGDIAELIDTVPLEAAERATKFMKTGIGDPYKTEIMERKVANADDRRLDRVAGLNRQRFATSRTRYGLAAGYTVGQIKGGSSQLTTMLTALNMDMGGPDADKSMKLFREELAGNKQIMGLLSEEEQQGLFGMENANDVQRMLKLQKGINLSNTAIEQAAQGGLGVAIDIGAAMDDASLGLEPKAAARRYALMMSQAAFRTRMADDDPASKASWGQLVVAAGAGYTDVAAVMGITGTKRAKYSWAERKRIGYMAEDAGLEEYNDEIKSINKASGKLESKYGDLLEDASAEDRTVLNDMKANFSQGINTGTISTEAELDEFLAKDEYAGVVDEGAGENMRKRFKLRKRREKATETANTKYKEMAGKEEHREIMETVRYKEGRERRKDMIARRDANSAIESVEDADGTTFIGDVWETQYDDMSSEDKKAYRKSVNTINDAGFFDRLFFTDDDVRRATETASNEKEVGQLSQERHVAIGEVAKLSKEYRGSTGGTGKGKAVKLYGTIKILERGRKPSTANAELEAVM